MGIEGKKPTSFVKKDVYAVLGVSSDVTHGALTARYKELVKALHPDQSSNGTGNPARLQEVTEAYQSVRTPDARRLYDLLAQTPKRKPLQAKPRQQEGKIFDRSDPEYSLQERLSGNGPI